MDESTTVARRGGGLKPALAWLVILGLLVLVAWLVSERNARSWHLVPDEGRLVVMRGMLLPVGRRGFETSDPALAQAYAPVVAPPGKSLPAERSFDDRALLDQALYDVLAGWARDEIASGDPGRLERGLGYLTRAEKLPGLSAAQREDLAGLRAESGFQEGLRLVGRAAEELRDAADKLRRAAGSRSPHAGDAAALLRDLEPALESATGALRAASRLARPPPEPAAATPPAPPPAADSAR
jgi:hypothetical protein